MRTLNCLVITIFFSLNTKAQQTIQTSFEMKPYQNGFLKNLGQVTDTDNKPVHSVFYQSNLGGQKVFITNYGISILLSRPIRSKKMTISGNKKDSSHKKFSSDSLLMVSYEMERIDIVLKNASILSGNILAKANPKSPLFNLNFNSFKNENQGLQLQSEILIKNVYPGIDWKIYIKDKGDNESIFKYDFIINPGADPAQIQIHYSENANLSLADNEIVAKTKMGIFHEKKPYSYLVETNDEIRVNYKIRKNAVSFITGNYDKTKTLIIDPTIFWLTYLSSTNHVNGYLSVVGNDVETDAAGNIFVQMSAAGNTPFPTLNPGGGAYYQDYTASPNGSMNIVKFSRGGQMLWSTYFGNGVGGSVMTIDKFGNIVAIGTELSSTPQFPYLIPKIPLVNNGGYYDSSRKKYFISKFSNSGILLWSSYFVNFASLPMDMSYDISGNIYVTGWSEKFDFPVVDPAGGAYITNPAKFGSAQTIFISQFDINCNLTWSTRIEGNSFDPYARVCTDKLGNIYIGGHTRSTNFPLVNAGGYFNTNSYGSIITRFNPARQMTWSTYIPGAFSLSDLTVDDSCNLYVVSSKQIFKFNSKTQLIFNNALNFSGLYFWNKINYDSYHDQMQLLGVMNDSYYGFPTINTLCKGSFFHNGTDPFKFATGPIFATMNHDGSFSYLSLSDWPYEYYDQNEMTIDPYGDPIYLFGHNQNGYVVPNPQLTDPGKGAYFDNACCFGSNGNSSALLLKLTSSEISATAQVTPSGGCSCNGAATVTTQCGNPPFSYLWSNGATTASVAGLCPGNYSVKIIDANNHNTTININIPDPPGSIQSVSTSVTPENCNKKNGSVSIKSVQGGTSPYSFSLDGINFTMISKFTGLDSGQIIIRVKDANGCLFNDTVTVSRLSGPSSIAYTTQKSGCNTGSGKLQVTGVTGGISPYHYTLNSESNSTGIFTNLPPGTYLLAVADSAGCQTSTSVVIDRSAAATSVTYSTSNDHCSQGIGFLQVSNVTGGIMPYTFSLDSISFTSATSLNKLKEGNYSLYIKDSNGCILKQTPIAIGNEQGPNGVSITMENAVCGKLAGILNINSVQGGTGTMKYSIDSSSYTSDLIFTDIKPGHHLLYVKDDYDCIYQQPFQIIYTPLPKIILFPADTTICYGENLTLRIIGDTNKIKSVSWSIPVQGFSTIIKPPGPQTIFVKLIDNNDCIIKDTALVKVITCNAGEKCIVIPKAFTPNMDGRNDWIGPIANGCKIDNMDFKVFNRWGQLVFESKDLSKKWNGVYKGVPQPLGVYLFTCTYATDDGINRKQNGVFTLIR